jgi:hypothetical protein
MRVIGISVSAVGECYGGVTIVAKARAMDMFPRFSVE